MNEDITKTLKALGSCIIMLSFFVFDGFSQSHPLSRHDSALVVKYLEEYQNQLNNEKNLKDASHYLNEIAFIYWEHNQYKKAIGYYKESVLINEKIENENGVAMINNNLGMLHADIRDYESSYKYFIKTLGARRSKDEKIGVISALINLSVVLNNLQRYEKSIEFLQEALRLAREMKDVDQMKSCYGMLSETYEKAGNAKQSIYYFDLYKTFTELTQQKKIDEVLEDYSEEKLLKSQLEQENKKKEQVLALKQEQIRLARIRNNKFSQKLTQYDSINKTLTADLNEKELQLELLKKENIIMSLKDEQVIQKERLQKEKEKTRFQTALIIVIALIILVIITIMYLIRYRGWGKDLKEKNNKIRQQQHILEDLNSNLLRKVEERTSYLRVANEKLSEYIFANNHVIRRPVANIQGIIHLIKESQQDDKVVVDEIIFEKLIQSIEELDEALKESDKNLILTDEMKKSLQAK